MSDSKNNSAEKTSDNIVEIVEACIQGNGGESCRAMVREGDSGTWSEVVSCMADKIRNLRSDNNRLKNNLMASSERYHRLKANVPEVVFEYVLNPDGSYAFPYISDSILDVLGLDAKDIMRDGHVLMDKRHPEDIAGMDHAICESAEKLQPFLYTSRYEKNGEIRWFEIMSHPERMPDRSVVWDGIAFDVTDQIRAVEALRASEYKYRILFQSTMDAFGRTDMSGRIVETNRAFQDMTGYTEAELLEMRFQDITPDNWHEYEDKTIREQVLVRDYSDVYVKEYRCKDGTVVPVELRTFLLRDSSGKPMDMCAIVRDIRDRKNAVEAMHRKQLCVDHAPIGIVRVHPDGRFSEANDVYCEELGYTREELLGMTIFDVDPLFTPEKQTELLKNMGETVSVTFESMQIRKDGGTFPVEVIVNFENFDGQKYTVAFVRNISERKRIEAEKAELEARLAESRKLESIGRLAGGIAHDFNNMLGVILGYAEMIRLDASPDSSLHSDLMEIEKAANRSRDITRQLLAFSQKQFITPKPLNLNVLISGTQAALSRLIGDDIDLKYYPGPRLWTVRFDSTQIDQILVNLAVNARDAMPDGGVLTIETKNVVLEECLACHAEIVSPGHYVVLKVSDNGPGMDGEVLSHAFEPFYTTKEVGKGPGLGLSTVYGIVRQNGGYVNISSGWGKGTVFEIYLPRVSDAVEPAIEETKEDRIQGTGTILLVEDEEMVRRMTQLMVESLGYTVISAESPHHALELCKKKNLPIDLLLTDVVMPGIDGTQLAERVRAIRPDIRVVFMSGYTANAIMNRDVFKDDVKFIQKPFDVEMLTRGLHEAMSGKTSTPNSYSEFQKFVRDRQKRKVT
jgi:two-component system cell cycle sensor histidine kinase/response regulator CckA